MDVYSTAIRKVGYDAPTMQMYIDFEESAPIYTFCRVPERIFRELVSAPSAGLILSPIHKRSL
ncbi:KTSC domain-containing protein [Halomonas sp. AOP42-C1-46]|uniref:KTSC domain-containing protein n=1 Tax=Halomonas sp. AOP42-C1-46 TaxID=3457671 RepID=UPI0040337D23